MRAGEEEERERVPWPHHRCCMWLRVQLLLTIVAWEKAPVRPYMRAKTR